jgi:glycosyltransferase involved in cell wall biosynthesis
MPTVTIGMPLYNEETYVGEALRSLLDQTFTETEIVVSDNASTDRTAEICRAVAAGDPRVRYSRNEANVGAAANFNRVMEMARGRFFMWAGGHDLWDRELVARSVAVMDERPEAVVALAECRWIGRDGQAAPRRSGHTDTSGMSAIERFFTVLWGNMHPVLGLMRSDALRHTSGVQSCMGADLLLLCELALRGDFVFVPGTCWYRREIRPQETYAEMMRRNRGAQYRLASGVAARMPLLSLGARLLGTVWRAPLPLPARVTACAGLAATMPARYVGARLRRR